MTLTGRETPEEYQARMEKHYSDPAPAFMLDEYQHPDNPRLIENTRGDFRRFVDETGGVEQGHDVIYLDDEIIKALQAGKVWAFNAAWERAVMVLYRPSEKQEKEK